MDKFQATAMLGSSGNASTTMRAFPDMQQRLAVGQEAAWEGAKLLADLRSRLGIPAQFGQTVGDDPQIEPAGEVDALTRAIERLTDTCRDIRGLAETLHASL